MKVGQVNNTVGMDMGTGTVRGAVHSVEHGKNDTDCLQMDKDAMGAEVEFRGFEDNVISDMHDESRGTMFSRQGPVIDHEVDEEVDSALVCTCNATMPTTCLATLPAALMGLPAAPISPAILPSAPVSPAVLPATALHPATLSATACHSASTPTILIGPVTLPAMSIGPAILPTISMALTSPVMSKAPNKPHPLPKPRTRTTWASDALVIAAQSSAPLADTLVLPALKVLTLTTSSLEHVKATSSCKQKALTLEGSGKDPADIIAARTKQSCHNK
ncbi:hypothetical protein FRB94_012943 [Tulasnella sp. JGI-2019a]|nr:hypothetical protein FRB94_012943 [Tulasnella sp. JGI-2019a]